MGFVHQRWIFWLHSKSRTPLEAGALDPDPGPELDPDLGWPGIRDELAALSRHLFRLTGLCGPSLHDAGWAKWRLDISYALYDRAAQTRPYQVVLHFPWSC